jgi:undecaprenyl-diphosphatase
MIEWLLDIDRTVFSYINGTLANPVTDFIMPVVTSDNLLRALFALVVIAIIVIGRRRYFWLALMAIAVVAVTDQASSALLKPLFARPRPCHSMTVHLLVDCGSGYSFPSSHAANLFGQALFFGLLYKKYLPYALACAFLVGISRIWVGVHYPLDMIGGMILGSLTGTIAAWVCIKWKLVPNLSPKPNPEVFSRNEGQNLSG